MESPRLVIIICMTQMQCKTRYSHVSDFFLPYAFFSKKSLRFFWGLLLWMLSIGRARHPGPGTSSYPSGFSIEFLIVGGWLSGGDLALESTAHFLAIAEHRVVPARARICHYPASSSSSLFCLGTVLSGCHSWWPCWCGRH